VRWAKKSELAQYKLEKPALEVIRKAFKKSTTETRRHGED
jgi:hypothetical protein